MRRAFRFFVLLPCVVFAQTASRSAAHPDLNGTWTLNAAQSDFGQATPPVQQSEDILQAGDEFAISITIERPEMKQHYTLRFQAGGETMPLPAGSFPDSAPFRILSVKGAWEGQTLVITERLSFQGADGTLTARYALSASRKVLRKQSHVSMSAGEFDTLTVYDKQ